MKKFFFLVKQKFSDKFFIKIYLSACMPVLLVFAVLMFEMFAFTSRNVSTVKTLYSEKLSNMYDFNERSLDNITMLINTLFDTGNFYNATSSAETDMPTSEISKLFNNAKETNSFIDSIVIYDKAAQKIYSDAGETDAYTYFTSTYVYSEYPKAFWDNYKSVMFSRVAIAPSEITTSEGTKTILPIVFTKLTNKYLSNLVIANIDVSKLLASSENEKISTRSMFFVVNKQRKTLYSPSGESNIKFSDDFYEKLRAGKNISLNIKFGGEKYIVIGQSPTDSIIGYTYIALIPYSDLYLSNHFMLYTFLFIALVLIAVLIVMIFITSGQIYEPIFNLLSILPKNTGTTQHKRNLLNNLQSAMKNMVTTSNMLSDKYNRILPLAQEKQLIDLLNQNKNYDFDLKTLDIDFQYDYFCVVVYKLIPTRLFYDSYTKNDYSAIKNGLIDVIQAICPEDFKCYILTSETYTIYSLLNVPDDSCGETIKSTTEEFLKSLSYDKKYLKATVSYGGIYSGTDGMIRSHLEATDKLGSFSDFNYLKTSNTSFSKKVISFTAADESAISNLLITQRTNEAKQMIEEMLKNLMDKNVSESVIYNFFASLLNLVFKVMQTKEIPYDTDDKGNIAIINRVLEQPIREIYDTVLSYIDLIAETDDTKTKIDIDSVIQYIETHFTEDLSLDMIASQYNTTAKYLSKLIKDKLGIKFTDFLSDLRVWEAKNLLLKSKHSIDEICAMSGFSNRTSFSRTFKAKTGMTPSEYKKFNK